MHELRQSRAVDAPGAASAPEVIDTLQRASVVADLLARVRGRQRKRRDWEQVDRAYPSARQHSAGRLYQTPIAADLHDFDASSTQQAGCCMRRALHFRINRRPRRGDQMRHARRSRRREIRLVGPALISINLPYTTPALAPLQDRELNPVRNLREQFAKKRRLGVQARQIRRHDHDLSLAHARSLWVFINSPTPPHQPPPPPPRPPPL